MRNAVLVAGLAMLPASGMTLQAAPGPRSEPNEPLSPTALIARIMSADGVPDAGVERLRPEDVTRRLWRNRIESPEPAEDVRTQAELEQMIRKIRSVRFETSEPPRPAPNPVHPVGQAPAPEAMASQAVPSPVAKPATRPRALPAEAGETLGWLLSNPDLAREPLQIAELLFLSGRCTEAAVLYRKALDLAVGESLAARGDQAWILLQVGNCLRDTDRTQARDAYARLIAEYPQSPWVELAKAHHEFLLWQERVQLDQLIVRQETQGAGQTRVAQGLR